MKVKEGLAPSVQDWIKNADDETLLTKFVEYSTRREVKSRDAEFLATIKGAALDEIVSRGLDDEAQARIDRVEAEEGAR